MSGEAAPRRVNDDTQIAKTNVRLRKRSKLISDQCICRNFCCNPICFEVDCHVTPNGLPFSVSTLKPFFQLDTQTWKKDTKGRCGILTIQPFHDADSIDEVWEFNNCLDALAKQREQLIVGDLRAWYFLWLCAAVDDNNCAAESDEPPVLHGIDKLPAWNADLRADHFAMTIPGS